MTTMHVNGMKYNVESWGSGAPVLALHGFTGDASTWAPLARAAGDEYRIIAPDLLGHGETASPAEAARYDMRHTVADLDALLDALSVDRVAVLGYSMGGRVALSFGVALRHRVCALVLESASPGIASPAERAARVTDDEKLAQFAEEQGLTAFVDRWQSIPLWASQKRLSNKARDSLRTQRLRGNERGLANSLRGIGQGAQPALHDALCALTVACCFVAGDEDVRYRDLARDMAAGVPNGASVIIPEAGHAAHLEQPKAFESAVLAFLRAHYPSRAATEAMP